MTRAKSVRFADVKPGTFVWLPNHDVMVDASKLTHCDSVYFCGVVESVTLGDRVWPNGRRMNGCWTVMLESGKRIEGTKGSLKVEPDIPSVARFYRRQGWDWAKALIDAPDTEMWRPLNGDTSNRAYKLAVLDDLLGTRHMYRGLHDYAERKALTDRCRRNASIGWDMQRSGKERP